MKTNFIKHIIFLLNISFLLGELPIQLERNQSYIYNFENEHSGEFLFNVTASSNTNWSEQDNESSILTIFLDGEYNQDIIIFNGEQNHVYKQSIGYVSLGEHSVELLFDYNKSSIDSEWVRLENIESINTQSLNVPYDIFQYSPIIYGRNIFEWNESNHTDIPLILYYELNNITDSWGDFLATKITYHVIFSNEDSRVGIGLSDMMLSWGRTTDIEWVYEIIIDLDGEIVSEIFQGASHTPTPFEGEKYGTHPILINATPNCNFNDIGTSDYKFFLSPFNSTSEEHTQEYLMDINPWTYKIMGEELVNEDKYENIQDPISWELSDVRNYLYVEYSGLTYGSNIECNIKASFYDDCYSFSNNHNNSEIFSSFGNGIQRTAIELPENFDIEDLQYLYFSSTGSPEYSIILNEITSIFYLSNGYVPIQIEMETLNNPITLNSSSPEASLFINEETLGFDCMGITDGEAFCDQCEICSGGETGIVANNDLDECGVCFGENQDMDCNGICFGDSYLDECYVCDDNPLNDNNTCNSGCFDSNAENYDPDATIFNNSCIYNDRTFHVPEEYEKIEYAIFFASDEDTVLVEPGVYYEELDFNGKNINLLSTYGPESTIIIANSSQDGGDGVFDPGETVITIRDVSQAKIDGFTLENGYGKGITFEHFISVAADENEFNNLINNFIKSGGLYVINSSITLSNMIIKNNTAKNIGGGIGLVNSNVIIDNIIIENNMVENIDALGGGGIGINGGATEIKNSIIRNNSVGENIYQLNGGGGIMCGFNFEDAPLEVLVSNTEIYSNSANIGAAIGALSGNITLDRVLIYDNIGNYGSAISLGEPLGLVIDDIYMLITNSTLANNHGNLSFGMIDNSSAIIANSILWNNGDDEFLSLPNNSILDVNIFYSDIKTFNEVQATYSFSLDPLFASIESHDYRLTTESPCIDTGVNTLTFEDNIIFNIDSQEYNGIMPDIGYAEFINQILGDLNYDEILNIFDIVILVEYVLNNNYILPGDLNTDNSLDIMDIVLLVNLILDL